MSPDNEKEEFPAFEDDEELFSEENADIHLDDELAKALQQTFEPASKKTAAAKAAADQTIPPLDEDDEFSEIDDDDEEEEEEEEEDNDDDDDDEDDDNDEDGDEEEEAEDIEEFGTPEWKDTTSADEPVEAAAPPEIPIPAVAAKSTKPLTPEELPMTVIVEVGRLQMSLKKLIELQPGNILELNLHPENGVNLVVNGKLIGKGELLLIGDALGVRILEKG